jgi:hypothetical protein
MSTVSSTPLNEQEATGRRGSVVNCVPTEEELFSLLDCGQLVLKVRLPLLERLLRRKLGSRRNDIGEIGVLEKRPIRIRSLVFAWDCH